jgi:hypothetical protein
MGFSEDKLIYGAPSSFSIDKGASSMSSEYLKRELCICIMEDFQNKHCVNIVRRILDPHQPITTSINRNEYNNIIMPRIIHHTAPKLGLAEEPPHFGKLSKIVPLRKGFNRIYKVE